MPTSVSSMIKGILNIIKSNPGMFCSLLATALTLAVAEFTFLKTLTHLASSVRQVSHTETKALILSLFIITIFLSTIRTFQSGLFSYVQNKLLNNTVILLTSSFLQTDYMSLRKKTEPQYFAIIDKLDVYNRDFIIPITTVISTIAFLVLFIVSTSYYQPKVVAIMVPLTCYFVAYQLGTKNYIKHLYNRIIVHRNIRIELLYTIVSGLFDIRSQDQTAKISQSILENEQSIRKNAVSVSIFMLLAKHWLEAFVFLSIIFFSTLFISIDVIFSATVPVAYLAIRCLPYITQIQVSFTQLQNGIAVKKEMSDALETLKSIEQETDKAATALSQSAIKKISVNCKAFAGEKLSLNCQFTKSNVATLSSDSGFGKSTIVHALAGFIPGAELLINDTLTTSKALTASTLLVSQKHFLDASTIDEDYSTLKGDLLHLLKLPQDLKASQAGYNGQNLSGGQRNRVAIVNALLSNNRIVIFDETLVGVEANIKEVVIEKCKSQVDKRFIILTHDNDVINLVQNRATLTKAANE